MKRALVALVIVFIVGTVFLVLRNKRDQEERSQRAETRFLQFNASNVTALNILHRGIDWRFERSDRDWAVTEPVADRADGEEISMVLTLLTVAQVLTTLEDETDLAQYGLDPPVAELRIGGVEAPRAWVGNEVTAGEGVYVRVEGRPGVLVVLLPEGAFLYDPNPMRLRERSVSGIQGTLVDRIEVRGTTGAFLMERAEDGWWITEPVRLPASEKETGNLIQTLEQAMAVQFLDGMTSSDLETAFGGDSPCIRLGAGGEVRDIVLGPLTGDGLRLVHRRDRGNTVLAVPPDQLEVLPLEHERFVSRKITKVNRYEVVSFEYRRGGEVLRAKRIGEEEWSAEGGAALEAEQVYSFLARLLEAKVEGWSAAAPEGGGQSRAVLTFETEDGYSDSIRYLPEGGVRLDSLQGIVLRARVRLPDPPAGS
jgi:hypothetical protein